MVGHKHVFTNSFFLQLSVILPNDTQVEYKASWKKAGVGVLLGLQVRTYHSPHAKVGNM